MLSTITRRELASLFYSPTAWVILAILQFILAYIFLAQIESFINLQARLANFSAAPGVTDLVIVPTYHSAAMIFLLFSPLLTMRLLSEERKNKTLTLLISAPVSNTTIILGKFFGIYLFFLILVFLTGLMTASLYLGTEIDSGKFFCNLLALCLICACYCSLGLYMSGLTEHPVIAATATFGSLLFLWILDWSAGLSHQNSVWLAYFSLLNHFRNLQSGLIDSRDIAYFFLFSVTFLSLSIRHMDNNRLQQ